MIIGCGGCIGLFLFMGMLSGVVRVLSGATLNDFNQKQAFVKPEEKPSTDDPTFGVPTDFKPQYRIAEEADQHSNCPRWRVEIIVPDKITKQEMEDNLRAALREEYQKHEPQTVQVAAFRKSFYLPSAMPCGIVNFAPEGAVFGLYTENTPLPSEDYKVEVNLGNFDNEVGKGYEKELRQDEAKRKLINSKEVEEVEFQEFNVLVNTFNAKHTENGGEITGTVINRSGKTLENITIAFKFYDENGICVDEPFGDIGKLKSGHKWKFKVSTKDTHWVKYQFSDLSGF